MDNPAAPIRRSTEAEFVEESFALRREAQKAYAEKAFAALGELAFQEEPHWPRVTALAKLLQQVLSSRNAPPAEDSAEKIVQELEAIGERVRAKLHRIAVGREPEEAGG